MIITNYTTEDLKRLPLRAIVALAARLRVPGGTSGSAPRGSPGSRTLPFGRRECHPTGRGLRREGILYVLRIRGAERSRLPGDRRGESVIAHTARWPPPSGRPMRRSAPCKSWSSVTSGGNPDWCPSRHRIHWLTWRISRPTWPRRTPSRRPSRRPTLSVTPTASSTRRPRTPRTAEARPGRSIRRPAAHRPSPDGPRGPSGRDRPRHRGVTVALKSLDHI